MEIFIQQDLGRDGLRGPAPGEQRRVRDDQRGDHTKPDQRGVPRGRGVAVLV